MRSATPPRDPLLFYQWFALMMKQSQEHMIKYSASLHSFLPMDFIQAASSEVNQRFEDFLKGIALYHSHPYQRPSSQVPIIWQRGSTQLLDYNPKANLPIVLCIPSLINRSYIFDLSEESSMMRYLAAQNLRPLLIDWGEMGEEERNFSLEDYIQKDLVAVLNFLNTSCVHLIGYCMGGLIAAALSRLRKEIKSLTLLATPWDFHSHNASMLQALTLSSALLEQVIDASRELPIEIIQWMFSTLSPLKVIRKFRSLNQNVQDLDVLSQFVAVEDWLNDCVPLAPKVAKECLFGWYRDNTPYQGTWQIAHQNILPGNITIPTLAIIPQKDVIVPPESAQALANQLPFCQVISPALGHIGSMVGRSAPKEVWEPITQFLMTQTH